MFVCLSRPLLRVKQFVNVAHPLNRTGGVQLPAFDDARGYLAAGLALLLSGSYSAIAFLTEVIEYSGGR